MKKSKKALSLLLSVVLALSALVFAPSASVEASASNDYYSYYVKVTYEILVNNNFNGAYGGYGAEVNDSVGISVLGRTYNGTRENVMLDWDLGTGSTQSDSATMHMDGEGKGTASGYMSGFPTKLYVYIDDNSIFDGPVIEVTKLEVGKDSSSQLTTLFDGTIHAKSFVNPYGLSVSYDGTLDASIFSEEDDDNYISCESYNIKNWKDGMPYAADINFYSYSKSLEVPDSSSDVASGRLYAAAYDQYGVKLFSPSWKINCSQSKTGISLRENSYTELTYLDVTGDADISDTSPEGQTCTVIAYWKGVSKTVTKSADILIKNPTYSYTFTNLKDSNGNDISDVTGELTRRKTPTAPSAGNYSAGDYDYTFSGWSPEVSELTSDTTYTAEYSAEFVAVNIDSLSKTVKQAEAIKASEAWKNGEYTQKSMSNLEDSLNTAACEDLASYGRTKQSVVDSIEENLKKAINDLEYRENFTVKFLDSEGNVISNQSVKSGDAAVAPEKNPEKAADDSYHYEFAGWSADFQNITQDVTIEPLYNEITHTLTTVETKAADCQHGSYTKSVCDTCGYTKETIDDTKGEHAKSPEYTVDTEAGCISKGEAHYYCTVCGEKLETVTLPEKGHTWDDGKVIAPTCTAGGCTVYTCARCSAVRPENVTSALGHNVTNWERTKAPTCAEYGEEAGVCTRCGETLTRKVEPTEHNVESWNITKAPTCTDVGEKTGSCVFCGETVTKTVTETGHKAVWTGEDNFSCEKGGTVYLKCGVCGEILETREVKKGEHMLVKGETVAPTCANDGYTKYTCSICGYETTGDIVSAAGHTDKNSDGVCDVCGEKLDTFRCKMCDAYEKNKDIPFVGFIYTIVHFFVHLAAVISSMT